MERTFRLVCCPLSALLILLTELVVLSHAAPCFAGTTNVQVSSNQVYDDCDKSSQVTLVLAAGVTEVEFHNAQFRAGFAVQFLSTLTASVTVRMIDSVVKPSLLFGGELSSTTLRHNVELVNTTIDSDSMSTEAQVDVKSSNGPVTGFSLTVRGCTFTNTMKDADVVAIRMFEMVDSIVLVENTTFAYGSGRSRDESLANARLLLCPTASRVHGSNITFTGIIVAAEITTGFRGVDLSYVELRESNITISHSQVHVGMNGALTNSFLVYTLQTTVDGGQFSVADTNITFLHNPPTSVETYGDVVRLDRTDIRNTQIHVVSSRINVTQAKHRTIVVRVSGLAGQQSKVDNVKVTLRAITVNFKVDEDGANLVRHEQCNTTALSILAEDIAFAITTKTDRSSELFPILHSQLRHSSVVVRNVRVEVRVGDSRVICIQPSSTSAFNTTFTVNATDFHLIKGEQMLALYFGTDEAHLEDSTIAIINSNLLSEAKYDSMNYLSAVPLPLSLGFLQVVQNTTTEGLSILVENSTYGGDTSIAFSVLTHGAGTVSKGLSVTVRSVRILSVTVVHMTTVVILADRSNVSNSSVRLHDVHVHAIAVDNPLTRFLLTQFPEVESMSIRAAVDGFLIEDSQVNNMSVAIVQSSINATSNKGSSFTAIRASNVIGVEVQVRDSQLTSSLPEDFPADPLEPPFAGVFGVIRSPCVANSVFEATNTTVDINASAPNIAPVGALSSGLTNVTFSLIQVGGQMVNTDEKISNTTAAVALVVGATDSLCSDGVAQDIIVNTSDLTVNVKAQETYAINVASPSHCVAATIRGTSLTQNSGGLLRVSSEMAIPEVDVTMESSTINVTSVSSMSPLPFVAMTTLGKLRLLSSDIVLASGSTFLEWNRQEAGSSGRVIVQHSNISGVDEPIFTPAGIPEPLLPSVEFMCVRINGPLTSARDVVPEGFPDSKALFAPASRSEQKQICTGEWRPSTSTVSMVPHSITLPPNPVTNSASAKLTRSVSDSVRCTTDLRVSPRVFKSADVRKTGFFDVRLELFAQHDVKNIAEQFAPIVKVTSDWGEAQVMDMSENRSVALVRVSMREHSHLPTFAAATVNLAISADSFECELFEEDLVRIHEESMSVKLEPRSLPISIDAITTVETVATVSATVGAFAANPTPAIQQARVGALLSMTSCDYAHDEALSFSMNPAGWAAGRRKGRYYRGALVGNLFVTVLILSFALLCTLHFFNPRRGRAWKSLWSSMGQLHLPGVLIVPIAFFAQGTASVSTSLLFHGEDPFDPGFSIGAWVILATVVGTTTCVTTLFFRAVVVLRVNDEDEEEDTSSVLARFTTWLFLSHNKWIDDPAREDSAGFKKHWQELFYDFKPKVPWYLGVELMISIALGMLDGVRSADHCVGVSWALLVLVFTQTAGAFFVRPFMTPYEAIFHMLLSGLTFASATTGVIGLLSNVMFFTDASVTIAFVASIIASVKGFLDMLFLLRWFYSRYRRLMKTRERQAHLRKNSEKCTQCADILAKPEQGCAVNEAIRQDAQESLIGDDVLIKIVGALQAFYVMVTCQKEKGVDCETGSICVHRVAMHGCPSKMLVLHDQTDSLVSSARLTTASSCNDAARAVPPSITASSSGVVEGASHSDSMRKSAHQDQSVLLLPHAVPTKHQPWSCTMQQELNALRQESNYESNSRRVHKPRSSVGLSMDHPNDGFRGMITTEEFIRHERLSQLILHICKKQMKKKLTNDPLIQ